MTDKENTEDMEKREYGFETLQLRAGQEIDPVSKGTAVPIYQSTAYVFDDMQYGADLLALKRPGNIYTRLNNTTNDVFEKRMAALENGVAAVATASGQSAVFLSVTNICGPGDNIVASPFLYGGTYTMFEITLRDMGIQVRFAASDSVEDLEKLIDDRTKAVYVEMLGNPAFNVPDLEPIAEMAHRKGVCVLTDNTFGCGGYLCRPMEWGANVCIHSATKWICGHGTALGGVVVDGGRFDWAASPRFPEFVEPDASYHGLVYTQAFGKAAYIVKARVQLMRDMGMCQTPQGAFYINLGLETLPMRMEKHCANALRLAQWLSGHEKVGEVLYPGLTSSPCHALAQKYMPRGCSGVVSFTLKGGREAGARFIDALDMISLQVHVADIRTCVLHPASSTHRQLSDEQLVEAGITPGMVRLSVGVEHPDDLLADLRQALDKA